MISHVVLHPALVWAREHALLHLFYLLLNNQRLEHL